MNVPKTGDHVKVTIEGEVTRPPAPNGITWSGQWFGVVNGRSKHLICIDHDGVSVEVTARAVPPEPEGVRVIEDRDGDVWRLEDDPSEQSASWVCLSEVAEPRDWRDLWESFGPLTLLRPEVAS